MRVVRFGLCGGISPLHPCRSDALDKRSLGKEKEDDHRRDHHNRSRHQIAEIRPAVGGLEGLQAQGEGVLVFVLNVDEWA